MAWNEHAKLEKAIDTLHETIQNQIEVTNKQSNTMIILTRSLLYFTIALFVVGIFQIAIFIQNLYTTPCNIQTNTQYKQMSEEKKHAKGSQPLPKIVKDERERHK